MPPCIILRSDGATLYATRDIAAAFYRKMTYDSDKILYCVSTQQTLHFRQMSKVLELMGHGWSKRLVHVANGYISLETGPMSTRKGNVVYLDDVITEVVSFSLEIIRRRSPGLEDKEETAKAIGIGAVKFSALKNAKAKDVVFSLDKVLSFEGETSCYIQYTHARIGSILRKAGKVTFSDIDFSVLTDDMSFDTVKLLSAFPLIIQEAAEEYEPSILSKYLLELVKSFNQFYHANPILSVEMPIRRARLSLCAAVKIVIKTGMSLLGIDCPERM
jgi:arginyl-tRNA synthetase